MSPHMGISNPSLLSNNLTYFLSNPERKQCWYKSSQLAYRLSHLKIYLENPPAI